MFTSYTDIKITMALGSQNFKVFNFFFISQKPNWSTSRRPPAPEHWSSHSLLGGVQRWKRLNLIDLQVTKLIPQLALDLHKK